MNNLSIQLAVVNHCYDTNIKSYNVDWLRFIERLKKAEIRNEKNGKAVIFAKFNKPSRAAANVTKITAIGLDVEINKYTGTHPPAPVEAASILESKSIEAAIYTTFSHTTEAPRYRVILPIDKPISSRFGKPVFKVIDSVLSDLSCWFDDKCKEPARLFFLPSVRPGGIFEFYHASGNITKADDLLTLIEQQHEKERQKRIINKLKFNRKPTAASDSVIQRFNNSFALEEILEAHGYKRKGKQFIAPSSESGVPGVKFFQNGKAYSFHNDKLSRGGVIDAFQAFLWLEYNGDMNSAIKAADRLTNGGVL